MTIKEYDIGDTVLCDWCNKDFTNSDESGGFMFGSKATGPCCAALMESDAKRYGEESHITARCPPDKSFWRWVIEDIRQGDNSMRILTGEDFEREMFGKKDKT